MSLATLARPILVVIGDAASGFAPGIVIRKDRSEIQRGSRNANHRDDKHPCPPFHPRTVAMALGNCTRIEG